MEVATKDQLKEQYLASSIAWKWFKKYFNMKNTDDNWHTAITEMSKLRVKYDSNLLGELLISYLNEIERHVKGETNERI